MPRPTDVAMPAFDLPSLDAPSAGATAWPGVRARRRERRGPSSAAVDAADDRLGPVDDRGGLDDVALHPELLGLEPEGEAEELRQVEDRHVELTADGALGERLLQVEVEVAQRARRHEAVGVG